MISMLFLNNNNNLGDFGFFGAGVPAQRGFFQGTLLGAKAHPYTCNGMNHLFV